MINKPKFMIPSTNTQQCVINGGEESTFSCIVDGNEAINKYKLVVYDLGNGNAVYTQERGVGTTEDTNVFDSNGLFYPINEKNQNNVLYIKVPSGKISNRSNAYYWTIQVWGTSGATSVSCEEVFYANTSPTIELSYSYDKSSWVAFGDNIELSENECCFKATYTSPDSPLKRYGWRIVDEDNSQVLVDTISHNQIYGTADNIICSYDGFLNNGNYSIELYTETQNGAVSTKEAAFSILYNSTFLSNDFRVEVLKSEPAIMLDWKDSVVIGGKMKDINNNTVDLEKEKPFKEQYPIVDYTVETPSTSVVIPENLSVVYDYGSSSNLDISEDCYIVLSTQFPDTCDRDLFFANGTNDDGDGVMRKLSFIGGVFKYEISSNGSSIIKTYEPTYSPNIYTWYVITMAPIINGSTQLLVNESVAENGVYPSDSLYPSDKLYPSFGTWTLKVEGGA